MANEIHWYMHLVNAEGASNRRLAEMLIAGLAAQHNGFQNIGEVDGEPTLIVDVPPVPTGDGHGPAGITSWMGETIGFREDTIEIVEAFEPGFTASPAYEFRSSTAGPVVWRPTGNDDLVFLIGTFV